MLFWGGCGGGRGEVLFFGGGERRGYLKRGPGYCAQECACMHRDADSGGKGRDLVVRIWGVWSAGSVAGVCVTLHVIGRCVHLKRIEAGLR